MSTFSELKIESEALPVAWVGEAFSQTLSASGGDGAPSWSLSSGALPDGITLSGAGVLGGTPTTGGSFTFTVQATGGGQTASRELFMDVYNQLTITTVSLPSGVEGSAYEQDLGASGGDGTYIWNLSEGALPPGLDLGSGGAITGTPTATDTYSFTVQVSSAGRTVSAGYELGVFDPLAITTAALPQGVTGSAYSSDLSAVGGDGAYTWAVSAGALPAGLSLAPASGSISGTPTEDGAFSVTIQVQSGDGQMATAGLSLEVAFVFSCSIQTEIPQVECEALEVLYNTTNGPGWTVATDWFSSFQPCDWH
ncbi:MAG: Ig domain-containing protein [Gemmatimonadota bacterium]